MDRDGPPNPLSVDDFFKKMAVDDFCHFWLSPLLVRSCEKIGFREIEHQ
jgi:hypothetical protein